MMMMNKQDLVRFKMLNMAELSLLVTRIVSCLNILPNVHGINIHYYVYLCISEVVQKAT